MKATNTSDRWRASFKNSRPVNWVITALGKFELATRSAVTDTVSKAISLNHFWEIQSPDDIARHVGVRTHMREGTFLDV